MTTDETTEKVKTPRTPEQKAMRKAGRVVARTLWRQRYDAENPSATPEQRQEAWKQAGKDETKKGMGIAKKLKQAGLMIVPNPDHKSNKSDDETSES